MPGLILNLPYSAQGAPPAVKKRLDLGPEVWQLEHWRLTDPHLADVVSAARIFRRGEGEDERPLVVYPYSPLVADPWGALVAELAAEAAASPPAPGIPPRTTEGKPIQWPAQESELIMVRSVAPFHQALKAAVEETLKNNPLALILTLRSFNDKPWRFEKDKKYPRPQVAVGADPELTPPGLAELAGALFRSFGWWPELNWPQGGAFAPPEFRGHPRVRAMGLSFSRSLYMDERSGRKLPSLGAMVRVMKTVFSLLDQELDRVARLRIERSRPRPKKKKPSSIIKAAPK